MTAYYIYIHIFIITYIQYFTVSFKVNDLELTAQFNSTELVLSSYVILKQSRCIVGKVGIRGVIQNCPAKRFNLRKGGSRRGFIPIW